MRTAILVLVFVQFCESLNAQGDSVKYGPNFVFEEGVYLTYNDFFQNKPIAIQRIVSNEDRSQLNFLSKEVDRKKITYVNKEGISINVNPDTVWGYCQNQSIYINYQGEFYRVPVVGSLFHFIGMEEVVVGYANPNFYNYGSSFPNTTLQQVQLIYDTKQQRFYKFNVDNMEMILAREPELLKQFSELSNRKRRQSTFIYLRRYNEKRPLYFYK